MAVISETGDILKSALAWMPPPSYMIVAVVLAGLIAASMAVHPGLAVICWPWGLAAAACLLGIVGAFRIVLGVGAPRWIGAVLALPCYLWAANAVKLMGDQPLSSMDRIGFGLAAQLAFLAAAGGALRLLEWLSKSSGIFRVGYVILALFAAFACLDSAVGPFGWTLTRTPYWLMPFQALRAASLLVAYGAFIGAALVLTMRQGAEPWTGIVISLIAAHMLYDAMRLTFVLEARGQTTSLFGSALVLMGAAAVWRIGALLRYGGSSEHHARVQ
jgi:hypothetical protein